MQLTSREYAEWWADPVTQHFLLGLQAKREETKENWARQAYVDENSSEKSARLNMYALASIDVLDQVIQLVEEARPQTEGEG